MGISNAKYTAFIYEFHQFRLRILRCGNCGRVRNVYLLLYDYSTYQKWRLLKQFSVFTVAQNYLRLQNSV